MGYMKLLKGTARPIYLAGEEVPGMKYKARAEQTAVPMYLVDENGDYSAGSIPAEGTVTRAALAPEVAAAILPVINVASLGADGTSRSANTVAMRTAVEQLIASNGGTIYVPYKTYDVDTTDGAIFNFPELTQFAIVGAGTGNIADPTLGQSGTRIRRTAGTSPILRAAGTGSTGNTRSHLRVEGIEFNGGGGSGNVVELYRSNEVSFRSVRINNAAGSLLVATQLWNSSFVDCFFYAGGSGSAIPATLFDGMAGEGISAASQTVLFANCQWEANTGTDIRITGSKSDNSPSYAFIFSGTKMERQVANASYPVLDFDYAARVHFVGFDIGAGGLGTTSPILTIPSTGASDAGHGAIHFSGGAFLQNGTAKADYYFDLSAGWVSVSNVDFLGTPNISYVKLASTVDPRAWRHDATVRFMDAAMDFTDQRSNVVTAGRAMRTLQVAHKSSGVTESALGFIQSYNLPDGATEKITGYLRMPEDAEPGYPPSVFISWTSTASTGNVRLKLEHMNASSTTDVSSTAPQSISQTVASPAVSGRIVSTTMNFSPTVYYPGGNLLWSISRIGGDALDTMTGDMSILGVSLFYRKRG